MMGSGCSSQRQSESSSQVRRGSEAAEERGVMSPTRRQGSVCRPLRHSVSSVVPDESIAALYPEEDNYVCAPDGRRSPKSLADLALDTLCRNLPLFHHELPSGLPQDVVDDIIDSLVQHSALNATTLRALRNCELRSLNLAKCRLVTDDWLAGLCHQVPSIEHSPVALSAKPGHFPEMEEMDVPHAESSPEYFYGTFEEASESSMTSFVSANEDHSMEDVEPAEEEALAINMPPSSCEMTMTSNLKVLDLRGSQLSDKGLLQLTGLGSLDEIRLDGCHSLLGHGLLACSSSHQLRTISLANCRRLTDNAVINISHLLALQNLFLGGCRCLTDRSLSAIADMSGLRRLDMSRCDLITDKGLESLEHLELLEELNLGWCRLVTDIGIDFITRQTGRERNLRVLSVARCGFTSVGMEHIGRLRGLEELDLNGCTNVSSASLAETLSELHHLVNLNASYCPNITRVRLQGRIDRLKVLDLRYSAVTSALLLKLTALPSLEELNLDSCNVSDGAIAHLADKGVCSNLLSLDLADNSQLTDAGIAKIAKFQKIKRLSLFYCNVTNAGLKHLSQLKDLEVLNLDSREISDDGLLPLQCLTKLKNLDVFTGRITDVGCGHLSSIRSLESLELCGGGIGDFGCAQLAKLENLETLNLSQNDRITNRGAAALAVLSKLRSLNLSNTKVNAAALRFFSSLLKLESLALYGCRGIDSSYQLLKLQDELPNLKCLRVNSISENDGIYIGGDSDAESDSSWSGSGDLLQPSDAMDIAMEEGAYSDFEG